MATKGLKFLIREAEIVAFEFTFILMADPFSLQHSASIKAAVCMSLALERIL